MMNYSGGTTPKPKTDGNSKDTADAIVVQAFETPQAEEGGGLNELSPPPLVQQDHGSRLVPDSIVRQVSSATCDIEALLAAASASKTDASAVAAAAVDAIIDRTAPATPGGSCIAFDLESCMRRLRLLDGDTISEHKTEHDAQDVVVEAPTPVPAPAVELLLRNDDSLISRNDSLSRNDSTLTAPEEEDEDDDIDPEVAELTGAPSIALTRRPSHHYNTSRPVTVSPGSTPGTTTSPPPPKIPDDFFTRAERRFSPPPRMSNLNRRTRSE